MHWIIIIIIILFILLVLINVLIFILPIAVASVPAWGAGLGASALVFSAFQQHLVKSLALPSNLAKLIKIDFDGVKLNCSVQGTEVNRYADKSTATACSLLACIAVTLAVLAFVYFGMSAFQNYQFKSVGGPSEITTISDSTAFLLACFTCTIPIAYAFNKLKKAQDFSRLINEEVNRLMASANLSLKPAHELRTYARVILSDGFLSC